jgi:hypothetical protein
LGRIPRRAVGGAGSFSASPSANSVGRRERGGMQVRTHSVVCLRCYRPLAVRAPALASRDASRPRGPELGMRDPRRQAGVGKGQGRHHPALEEGQPPPPAFSSLGECRERARTSHHPALEEGPPPPLALPPLGECREGAWTSHHPALGEGRPSRVGPPPRAWAPSDYAISRTANAFR